MSAKRTTGTIASKLLQSTDAERQSIQDRLRKAEQLASGVVPEPKPATITEASSVPQTLPLTPEAAAEPESITITESPFSATKAAASGVSGSIVDAEADCCDEDEVDLFADEAKKQSWTAIIPALLKEKEIQREEPKEQRRDKRFSRTRKSKILDSSLTPQPVGKMTVETKGSFSFYKKDLETINKLQRSGLRKERMTTKSEIVRAGIYALAAMPIDEMIRFLDIVKNYGKK